MANLKEIDEAKVARRMEEQLKDAAGWVGQTKEDVLDEIAAAARALREPLGDLEALKRRSVVVISTEMDLRAKRRRAAPVLPLREVTLKFSERLGPEWFDHDEISMYARPREDAPVPRGRYRALFVLQRVE
jgi:hypothetical protein